MKKMFPLALVAALAFSVVAAESEDDDLAIEEENDISVKVDAPRKNAAVWPAFVALWDFPETPDLVGLRLTIPCSTLQENVTGLDIGFWGRCQYFEGFQLNILRNNVKDSCAGFQVGCYNSVTRGDLLGLQVGLWNEALSIRGLQAGLVNVSGDVQGFQFGVINRAETMYGFQVGAINVIRDAEVQFCPFVNIGF